MPDANKMLTEKKQSMVMLKPFKFKTLYFIAPYCSAITEIKDCFLLSCLSLFYRLKN